MKWIGWVFAALLMLCVALANHQGRRSLAAEKKTVDEQIAARKAEVESVLQRAADGIPARRERLAAEDRKVADLERQLGELEHRKASLDQTMKELAAAADKLRQERDSTTDKREEDKQQIRDVQDRIAAAETQAARLRKALLRVTQQTAP